MGPFSSSRVDLRMGKEPLGLESLAPENDAPSPFSLREMEDRWGSWSGKKREISLSRSLVLDHPWDAVCEVLLHEMAHQFTEEVFAAHHEPPHGPQFQKACHLLRANPKASGNYKLLDERIVQGSAGGEDRIMIRVKKLMALAGSPNQHEAEAAMGKAHELIARYNLDLLAQEEERNFTSVFVGPPALRHPPEDYALAHLLQDFYFVRGIWISAYVPARGKMGGGLEISGTTQNIKMASYVHDFVGRFIHSQWAAYNRDRGLNRHRQTDFALGIVEGFRSKLETQGKEKEKIPASRALIKMEDPLLKEYLAYKYPRTTSIRRGVSRQDKNVLQDGKRIGKKLVIARGIAEHGGSRGLMIGS